MSTLAAIHIKRKQLGIHEDDWRDLVERMTGQRSTKNLSPKQSYALLGELDRMLGGRTVSRSKPKRKSLQGPYAKKIQALWIACWNLALIEDRDDAALNSFAVKQANIDHANWLRDHDDAVAVIEAMKKMLERRGVDWSNTKGAPAYQCKPGFKVAVAQWRLLARHKKAGTNFAAEIRSIVDLPPHDLGNEGWIMVMNTFGRHIRSLQSEGVL